MSKQARITCKQCRKNFNRIEWMTNKVCENSNCHCPEVKKARQAANNAIEKAQMSSRIEKYEKEIPNEYNYTMKPEAQLFVNCPPVQVINITPQRKGK